MVSDRIQRTANAMNRVASYFTYNRDAAVVLLSGGVITTIVSILTIGLSISHGEFNTMDTILQEVVLGIAPAIAEVIIAISMMKFDKKHRILGLIGLLAGLVSLPGTDGGLFIGFILVLIGSVMSILFRGPYRPEYIKETS
jgi:hypothetical protein